MTYDLRSADRLARRDAVRGGIGADWKPLLRGFALAATAAFAGCGGDEAVGKGSLAVAVERHDPATVAVERHDPATVAVERQEDPAAVAVEAGSPPSVGAPPMPEDAQAPDVERIARTVVRIVGYADGLPLQSGSGTIVSADGTIHTNLHVVAGADDFEIELIEDLGDPPVPTYRARVVGFSRDVDFAVLRIDRHDNGDPVREADLRLPFLSSSTTNVKHGDRLFLFGYPGIGEGHLTYTEGVVASIRKGTVGGQRVAVAYQTDAVVGSGSSGGLAVNAHGEMVGLPTAVRTDGTSSLTELVSAEAVAATVEAGLGTGPAQLAEATAAVLGDERLNHQGTPFYGDVALRPGFDPDPHLIAVEAGGSIDASYLGSGCAGYAAAEPDYRVQWTGDGEELFVLFVTDGDDPSADATLVVRTPDGSWVCDDDSGEGLDPALLIDEPADGRYDVWVGNYGAELAEGVLVLTEGDVDEWSGDGRLGLDGRPGFDGDRPGLDHQAEPFYGEVLLRPGFRPDPHRAEVVAGGPTDVSYLGSGCAGFAAAEPDYRLEWSGGGEGLGIRFESAGLGDDPTLVVRLPDGNWVCDDDSGEHPLDPAVWIDEPDAGRYDIWVGAYEEDEYAAGVLLITEVGLPQMSR